MPSQPKRKLKSDYHHGDLQRSLIDAAVRLIQKDGVNGLTLRGVGARLGVSRTALYRHFADKGALLARVSLEGFRGLSEALRASAARAKKSEVLEELAEAYVQFALLNPAHYGVMFSEVLKCMDRYPDLIAQADDAFGVLVEAIAAEQQRKRWKAGEPRFHAHVIWGLLHGIATLGIEGLLRPTGTPGESPQMLARFGLRSLREGLGAR